MMNFLIVFSVLLIFVTYDIMLRVGRAVDRKGSVAYSEQILQRSLERIFALIRTYRAFTIDIDDRVGPVLPERFVLVANHQSIVDIPVLGYLFGARRLRFVAKKELDTGVPLVSQALRMQEHCFVTRKGDPGQALKALDRYARRCKENVKCPVIFPEGTRSRDGSLGTFHSGGLKRVLAAESIPIVVVALEGGSRIHGIKTIMKNLKGAWYKVRICAVLPAPDGKQGIMNAVARSRELVADALGEWRGLPC